MSESTERDHPRQDRLPDVRPAQATGNYTRFLVSGPGESTGRRSGPPVEEPAWWEVDEVASLPDARRWRAGSTVSLHLPVLIRTALDSNEHHRAGTSPNRLPGNDLESILGNSRYGAEDVVPVWTDADTVRERSSWKDQSAADAGGRRQKRSKRNRQDRQNDGRRDPRSR